MVLLSSLWWSQRTNNEHIIVGYMTVVAVLCK